MTELIPDSPNEWDSGRYDWPAKAPEKATAEAPPQPAKAPLPDQVLKDKRAISLYWIAVGALALVPVLAVAGLLLLAGAGREVPGEIITLIGTAASTALGGLVGMVATNGGSSSGQ